MMTPRTREWACSFFFSFFLCNCFLLIHHKFILIFLFILQKADMGKKRGKKYEMNGNVGYVCFCFVFYLLYKLIYFLHVLIYRFPPWWPELFRLLFSIWLLDGIQPSLSQWNQIREHLLLTAPAQSATGVLWRCVVWIWLQQWWERGQEEEGKTPAGAHGRSHSRGKTSHLFFDRKQQLLSTLWWALQLFSPFSH